MAPNDPRVDVARRPLVLHIPGMDEVIVQAEWPYRDGADGVFDLYSPAGPPGGERRPAVVFVMGFTDAGMRRFVGCSAKDMESYVTWARALAASGLIAITYTNADPVADAELLQQYVRDHADELGIDRERIAIWSCSANVPNALGLLMTRRDLAAAVLAYGYTLDLDGATAVQEAQARFGFACPTARRSIDDLPPRLPLCIVRAGLDTTSRLNESLDRFIAHVLKANRPVTLINADDQPHAFDSQSDTDASRTAIKQVIAFLRAYLLTGNTRLTPRR